MFASLQEIPAGRLVQVLAVQLWPTLRQLSPVFPAEFATSAQGLPEHPLCRLAVRRTTAVTVGSIDPAGNVRVIARNSCRAVSAGISRTTLAHTQATVAGISR